MPRYDCRIRITPYNRILKVYTDQSKFPKIDFEGYDSVHGITHVDGNSIHVGIYDSSINTLAHEMVHAAYGILSQADIPITAENQEALAYLTGWLVQTTLDKLKRRGTWP